MALIDYTSFDDVRAALGVSSDEFSDTTLSLDLYDFNLVSELEGVSLTLIPDYDALKETSPSTWTAIQKRFHQTVRVFSAYAVAKQATVSLPMFSPKEQTDGKAALVRFAQDPYKATIVAVTAQYEQAKLRLEVAYGAVTAIGTPVTIKRPYFVVASPLNDPVLGS